METLTLIRHAVTDWNQNGRFQGHTDIPLNDAGREQAELLAARTADFGLVEVVSSPSERARETAAIAFPALEPRLEPRLRELNFGDFEGRTLAENRAHPDWDAWYADPFDRRPPGKGESYRALRERVADWLEHALSADGAAHVVAVTHSGTIQMLLSHLIGVEHPRWRKRFYLRHTSITRVRFQSDENGALGHAVIERVNDASHLAGNGDPFLE